MSIQPKEMYCDFYIVQLIVLGQLKPSLINMSSRLMYMNP